MKPSLQIILAVAFASSAAAQSAALLPPAEGKTKYPLVLKTPYGTTTLKARPARVAVVADLQDFDAALALGVRPVVAPEGDWPWQKAALTRLGSPKYQAINIWADDGLPFETIAAAKPDVILAVTKYKLENDYKRLAQIAPVVALESYKTDSSDVTAAQTLRRIGLALDLQGRADQVLAREQSAIRQLSARHPEYKGKTVALVINRGEQAGLEFLNYKGSPTEKLLSSLGFARHPQADLFAKSEGDIKLEQLSRISADGLVMAQHGGNGKASDAQVWLERQPLYRALPAVRRGAVAQVQKDPSGTLPLAWSLSYPNPLSTEWTLGQLETAFGMFKK